MSAYAMPMLQAQRSRMLPADQPQNIMAQRAGFFAAAGDAATNHASADGAPATRIAARSGHDRQPRHHARDALEFARTGRPAACHAAGDATSDDPARNLSLSRDDAAAEH